MSIFVALYVTACVVAVVLNLDDWNRTARRPLLTLGIGLSTGIAFICAWLGVFR